MKKAFRSDVLFDNEHVFLLDTENKEITSPGTSGEICIRGTALALGYFRAPEQNAAAFVQNPLNSFYPEVIYRTGDLGQYNNEGDLLFCGPQRFFRSSIWDIALNWKKSSGHSPGFPALSAAAVFLMKLNKNFTVFISAMLKKKDIYEQLRNLLPVYMIPGALQPVENFPLTKNGKTDRKLCLKGGICDESFKKPGGY